MKSVILSNIDGFDGLKLVNIPDPIPKDDEVLVRIKSVSLNYRDILITNGGYGSRQKTSNLIPLSDAAGEVIDVGKSVTLFKQGDKVTPSFFQSWNKGPLNNQILEDDLGRIKNGVLCEYKCFKETSIVKTPESLNFNEAASLPCAGLTAWSGIINLGKVKPGQVVLTQGSGGVSLFSLQFAKMVGAKIIATSSSEKKLEKLKALGADYTINYIKNPKWGQEVLDYSSGVGVDHIMDVGGGDTLKQSLRAIKPGGTISLVGVLDNARSNILIPLIGSRNIRLQGVTVGSIEELKKMNNAIEENNIKPVIDKTFDFLNFKDAYLHLQSGKHFGKVCINL